MLFIYFNDSSSRIFNELKRYSSLDKSVPQERLGSDCREIDGSREKHISKSSMSPSLLFIDLSLDLCVQERPSIENIENYYFWLPEWESGTGVNTRYWHGRICTSLLSLTTILFFHPVQLALTCRLGIISTTKCWHSDSLIRNAGSLADFPLNIVGAFKVTWVTSTYM